MFNTYSNTKTIIVNSRFGLGDALIDFIFFSQIAKYIEHHNIHINYHCQSKHHANLTMFKSTDNINILPYENIGYELWQGHILKRGTNGKYCEDMLCEMFNEFLQTYNIPIQLFTFEYQFSNLHINHMDVSIEHLGVDTLIINSTPTSGQFIHDKNELNDFIINISKSRNVAVTEYINDSIISLHNKPIRYIASLATKVKTIIAINTGPSLALYNPEILDAVDNIYILDTTDHYVFKTRKFTKIKYIRDLQFLL